MRRSLLWYVLTAALLLTATAKADTTKLVVPFPAGGATDTMARFIALKLSAALGDTTVVENQPGAGGIVAARHVASSPPDGKTILVAGSGSTTAIIADKSKEPGYSLSDFAPICGLARFSVTIVVRSDSPFRTLQDVLTAARAEEKKISIGWGNTVQQTIPRQLEKRARLTFLQVPLPGGEPKMVTEVLGGRLHVGLLTVGIAKQYIGAGNPAERLRALAIVSEKRSSLLRDVPTVAETGVDWTPSPSWVGLIGPRNLPKETLKRLEKACLDVLETADAAQKLESLGFDPMDTENLSSEGFRQFLQDDLERWTKILRL